MNEIRDQAPPRSGAAQPSASRALAAVELSDDVDRLITSYLDELRACIPRLRPWRGFSSGRWVIGAHSVPDHASPLPSDYSRVDFELSVSAEQNTVEVTCRSTVRGRDRSSHSLQVALDADGRRQLATWIESALLEFANGFYPRGTDAPPGG